MKNMEKIDQSKPLEKLGLEKGKYILVSAHREENIDIEKNFFKLMNGINMIAEHYNIPVIYSTHPRSMKKIEERNFKFNPLVKNLKPFGFFEYNKLQKNAYAVISDSGTLSEESSMLNFPGILIRTSTERPEVLDKGNMIIGGIEGEEIIQAIDMVRTYFEENNRYELPVDYRDINVADKVVRIILSYYKIIDKVIWGK